MNIQGIFNTCNMALSYIATKVCVKVTVQENNFYFFENGKIDLHTEMQVHVSKRLAKSAIS